MPEAKAGPVTVVVVGAGHRSVGYAEYALKHPDLMKVVAVAEPLDVRRRPVAERHHIPLDMQFRSYEELARRPPVADAIINGTMDQLHHASGMALIQAGYHMLLEKPIARTEQHVRDLIAAAEEHKRIVMIGHVLRCAPFYATAKQLVESGRIGRVLSIRMTECVSYDHMVTAFVRGRWRRREANPLLTAKSCHDLDIMAWLKTGVRPVRVASFGQRTHFRIENAPQGSADRCLNGCRIERSCQYSAKRIHVDRRLYKFYAWESIENLGGAKATDEQKLESLRTTNPFGRCAWRCDNDVVDHQVVIVEFADGTMGSFSLFTNAADGGRDIWIIGAEGDIEGNAEDGLIKLRRHCRGEDPKESTVETIDPAARGSNQDSGHGGGDEQLIADFVATLRGEEHGRGSTRIQDSLAGHLIAFAADAAMIEGRVVDV